MNTTYTVKLIQKGLTLFISKEIARLLAMVSFLCFIAHKYMQL